jgi:pilus assembly protein Flp/PilA
MIAIWKRLHRDESGQDLIEYALIAALIAVATVASMNGLATAIKGKLDAAAAALN